MNLALYSPKKLTDHCLSSAGVVSKKHIQFFEHVHEWIENTSVIGIHIEASFLY